MQGLLNAWRHWRRPGTEPAIPDPEAAALARLHAAHQELERLGWKGAIYCPKDGTVFLAIEPGTGVPMRCAYWGEWPTGGWWELDSGDAYPVRPSLFKLLPPPGS